MKIHQHHHRCRSAVSKFAHQYQLKARAQAPTAGHLKLTFSST